MRLWVCVGSDGQLESFGDDWEALLDYLNTVGVGQIVKWMPGGFTTANYWGDDYVSLYWGNASSDPVRQLDARERDALAAGLTEVYV